MRDAAGNETASTPCTFVGEVTGFPSGNTRLRGSLTVNDDACDDPVAVDTGFDSIVHCL